MNRKPTRTRESRARPGFTIAELIGGMVIGGLVATGVVMTMLAQQRSYQKQQELSDVRDTERSAIVSLNWDLRHSGVGGSQLLKANVDSVTLRSVTGLGIVCAKHATLPRFGVWRTSGSIQATTDDSALVYGAPMDRWRRVKISAVGTPAAMGVGACAWPGARPPDVVVEITVGSPRDTSDVVVGAPFRAFQNVTYAEYQTNGRWWLGRRIGAAATWDQLTGPLFSPTNRGIKFAFYDSMGAGTTNPALVKSTALIVRAMSEKQYLNGENKATVQFAQDSFTTKVRVRR